MTKTGSLSRKQNPFRHSTTGSRAAPIDLSFWRAPERLFDEPDELIAWARLALAAARRVAAKRAPATSKRQSRR
jgi:DNA transformation protein